MKQDIYCKDCRGRIRDLAKKYNEPFKSLEGRALEDFECDGCCPAVGIKKGEICYACSQWKTTAPYFEWEHHFIGPV